MNQQQKGILWIGVLVVLVFLFTDQSFRDKLFGRGSQKPAATVLPYTAAQIFSTSPQNQGIILDALTALPANSGSSPNPQVVLL